MHIWSLAFALTAAWAEEPAATRGLEGGAFDEHVDPGVGITRYRAILFGAQRYPEASGLPALQTPGKDVERLAAVLKDQYGFEVEVVLDPTRADIIDHLAVLRDAKPDEAFVVYYAGHGQRDADQDRTWWIPVDATSGSTANWVSNDDVAGPVRASPARHILLVSDSCFSGGLLRGVETVTANPQSAREASTLASRVSRWVLTSGGEEPVSDAGFDGMSVFAFHFAQSLANARQSYVTVDGIFPELRQSVIRDSEQMPESGALGKGFHQGGQLVLANKLADPDAVAAVADQGRSRTCTLSDLQRSIEVAEAAYRGVRGVGGSPDAAEPFLVAAKAVDERTECVDAPLDPGTVVALHRLQVLGAILTGEDERGVQGLRAMRAADPQAGWSTTLGAAPAEWTSWLARAQEEREPIDKRLPPALGGWLLVDGVQVGAWKRTIPRDRPYVFQFQRESEDIVRTQYVDAGDPPPAYPTPMKAQFRTIGGTLLLVGATGMITSLPVPLGKLFGTTDSTAGTQDFTDDPLYAMWKRNQLGFIIGTSTTGVGLGFIIAAAVR